MLNDNASVPHVNQSSQHQLVDIDTGGVGEVENERKTKSIRTFEQKLLIYSYVCTVWNRQLVVSLIPLTSSEDGWTIPLNTAYIIVIL